jgi:hypothetical protein
VITHTQGMSTAGKSIIAFLYALAVVAVPFIDGTHAPSSVEWVQIAIAAATAITVYLTPLIPQAPYAKTAVGAVLAGLQVLVTVIDGGVSGSDVLLIVVAVAAAAGIQLAPAMSTNGVAVPWGSDVAR